MYVYICVLGKICVGGNGCKFKPSLCRQAYNQILGLQILKREVWERTGEGRVPPVPARPRNHNPNRPHTHRHHHHRNHTHHHNLQDSTIHFVTFNISNIHQIFQRFHLAVGLLRCLCPATSSVLKIGVGTPPSL